MRITAIFLFQLLLILSCNQDTSKDALIQEQQARINELEQQAKHEEPFDSSNASPPVTRRADRKMHFPDGMFNTYPQIINYLLAIGSTMDEVLNILGEPDYVESKQERIPNTGNYYTLETWYYGKMEIEFRTGVVNDITNYEDNKHCFYNYGIELADLYISDNYIEKKWSVHLVENKVKSQKQEFVDGINRAIR